MGRYVSTGTAQPNTCTTISSTTCYQVPTHIYSYDANECWQNKVVLNVPGTYTFTMPAGTSGCIRAIAVGGGGKAICSDFYCNFAGSGGGYAESVNAVAAGCTFSVVVGRQQQDTTVTYTCTGGVQQVLTGGGAVATATGSTPGAASGGNFMNSRGGCGGWGRNYQEAQGACPSTCMCFYTTTCCGYCIVYQCMPWTHALQDWCTVYLPGGGSAGSFVYNCGGCGGGACNKYAIYSSNNNGGPVAGGGGGIGSINKLPTYNALCGCICATGATGQPYTACMGSSGGGGGSRWSLCVSACDQLLWNAMCIMGTWRDGGGGRGGLDEQEGRPGMLYWYCVSCSGMQASEWAMFCSIPPKRYPWHDIHSMTGSGSSGKSIAFCTIGVTSGNWWAKNNNWTGQPEDAGEGAGTGGSVYPLCDAIYSNWKYPMDNVTGIDWIAVCQLGISGRFANAYNPDVTRQIVPGFVSFAGTLGGSGGIGMCGYASKAGPGGGAGTFKSFIRCICYGTGFDCCNGNIANGLLAFPPCILDNISSNAGSGMAIIYWKD